MIGVRRRLVPLVCVCGALLGASACKKSQDSTPPLPGSSDLDDMLDAFIPRGKPGPDVEWLTLEALGSEQMTGADADSWKLSVPSGNLLVQEIGIRDPRSYEVRGDVDKVTLRRALRKGIGALGNGRSYRTLGRDSCQRHIDDNRAKAVDAYPDDVDTPDDHVVILQQSHSQKYVCTIPYDEAPELAKRHQLYLGAKAALKKFFAAVGREPLP